MRARRRAWTPQQTQHALQVKKSDGKVGMIWFAIWPALLREHSAALGRCVGAPPSDHAQNIARQCAAESFHRHPNGHAAVPEG